MKWKPERRAHYLRRNEAVRFPHRWVVLDTEAHRLPDPAGERQFWRCAVACRWRDDTKRDSVPAYERFTDPAALWEWVAEWTRTGNRTVLWCHNLSYDLRISQALTILPAQGWELEWCNLDRQVSTVRFTCGGATLLMADLTTWCPHPLEKIGAELGIQKPELPAEADTDAAHLARCEADVEITTAAVQQLLWWAKERQLGNWQPSGAGMAWAWWRHRHLEHELLVHTDPEALEAERAAMHTGRCEAYRHGAPLPGRYTEWDMHMAYPRIALTAKLPARLCAVYEAPSLELYRAAERYQARLCRVRVELGAPVLPTRLEERYLWPLGSFTTTVWDVELDAALEAGAKVEIERMWGYRRAPFLRSWAEETFALLEAPNACVPPVVRRWLKHQSRALIGRLALRYPTWDEFGANPERWLGLSYHVRLPERTSSRLLALGHRTFLEGAPQEGESSLPQATGWIMAACRARLWHTLQALDPADLAYCDTDSVIVTARGDRALAAYAAAHPELGWRRKRSRQPLSVWGPRQLQMGEETRFAGLPRRAQSRGEGRYAGQVWESLATSLQAGQAGSVLVSDRSWQIQPTDRRRVVLEDGWTVPYRLAL